MSLPRDDSILWHSCLPTENNSRICDRTTTAYCLPPDVYKYWVHVPGAGRVSLRIRMDGCGREWFIGESGHRSNAPRLDNIELNKAENVTFVCIAEDTGVERLAFSVCCLLVSIVEPARTEWLRVVR